MLTRIYVDNYKCLANFEYQPGTIQLILGGNGSGKSTIFEVLALLRALVIENGTTTELFPASTLTRWQQQNYQTFELSVAGNGGTYQYKLVVEHQPEALRSRIFQEQLSFDEHPLFSSQAGEGRLYQDDHTAGPTVLLDWNRSGLSLLSQRSASNKLHWFKEWIGRVYRIQINPYAMTPVSTEEQPHPSGNLANYASWYRHLSQEEPNVVFHLFNELREIIDGFESFSLTKEGENTRVLKAEVRDPSGKVLKYNFDELSEGQRALTGLYTLLAVMHEMQITLCIDEPDNYIMLAEIQPWLTEFAEMAEAHASQVLVISHHPEIINYFAPRDAVRFFRQHGGPVRVKPFTIDSAEHLPPAEIIARGWDHE